MLLILKGSQKSKFNILFFIAYRLLQHRLNKVMPYLVSYEIIMPFLCTKLTYKLGSYEFA